jgi:hypothetical protein
MFLPLGQEHSQNDASEGCGGLLSGVRMEFPEPIFVASWTATGLRGVVSGTAMLLLESDLMAWASPLRTEQLVSLQLIYPCAYQTPWLLRNVVRVWSEYSDDLQTDILVMEGDDGARFTRWMDCPVPQVGSHPVWSSASACEWRPDGEQMASVRRERKTRRNASARKNS